MLRSQRLHQRLSVLLLDRYGLSGAVSNEPADEIDLAIALSSAEELEELALRAGAIYWAGSLAAVIDGRQAAALQAALGAEICAFAVANRDLAGPMQPLEPLEDIVSSCPCRRPELPWRLVSGDAGRNEHAGPPQADAA